MLQLHENTQCDEEAFNISIVTHFIGYFSFYQPEYHNFIVLADGYMTLAQTWSEKAAF